MKKKLLTILLMVVLPVLVFRWTPEDTFIRHATWSDEALGVAGGLFVLMPIAGIIYAFILFGRWHRSFHRQCQRDGLFRTHS